MGMHQEHVYCAAGKLENRRNVCFVVVAMKASFYGTQLKRIIHVVIKGKRLI